MENVIYRLLLLVVVLTFAGCVLPSSHEQFIRSMDAEVSWGFTIREAGYDARKPEVFFVADQRYLVRKERISADTMRFFYAREFLVPDQKCHYYLEVDANTEKILGWGFTQGFSDQIAACSKAG